MNTDGMVFFMEPILQALQNPIYIIFIRGIYSQLDHRARGGTGRFVGAVLCLGSLSWKKRFFRMGYTRMLDSSFLIISSHAHESVGCFGT
jgi:hypothetical protein